MFSSQFAIRRAKLLRIIFLTSMGEARGISIAWVDLAAQRKALHALDKVTLQAQEEEDQG